MAQYDVSRLSEGDVLVVDCQSDLLDQIESRFVVPIVPLEQFSTPARRLNPVFEIEGRRYVMLTQSASAVSRRELGPVVTSLADHDREIMNALDLLLTGV